MGRVCLIDVELRFELSDVQGRGARLQMQKTFGYCGDDEGGGFDDWDTGWETVETVPKDKTMEELLEAKRLAESKRKK